MIVFLVSGLWHGASWHFVVWGGINGIYNVIQDYTETIRKKLYCFLKIDTNACIWKCFCGLITFFFIDISWLFFRASGMYQSLCIIRKIGQDFNPWYFFSEEFYYLFDSARNFSIAVISLMVLILIDILKSKNIELKKWVLKQQIIFRWCIYLMIIFIIMMWGAYGSDYVQTQFIYFQF